MPRERGRGGVSAETELEWVAAPEEAGTRLDVALGARPEVGSRAAAQRLIDAGRVRVDGAGRQKRHALAVGERVQATIDDGVEAPSDAEMDAAAGVPYAVAYEDEHLIVVDKPAGVVVHPAPGHPTGTLVQALAGRAAGGDEPWRPGIVHRLDRDTSGLLVVAKSDSVLRALQAALRAREVSREYLALVAGRPASATGTIEAPLGRDRGERTLVSVRTDRPKEARTHFTVEETLARTTLLRVTLDTGRTHQIRAHLSAIGLPVCGDRQYGGAACGAELGLDRQFLHAARLVFPHPVGGEEVECGSALPADLEAALLGARGGLPVEAPAAGAGEPLNKHRARRSWQLGHGERGS